MAQQVKIAGALFNDVPYIQCPDVNDVYHAFYDTTIETNAASATDIASGKKAYVNGALVTGSATVPVLTTKNITANGTYNASSDSADGYSSVTVNVSGGGGGLIYETGTYTPTSDIAKPTISFINTHTASPIYVLMADETGTDASSSSNLFWRYSDFESVLGAGINFGSSTTYGYVDWAVRTSSSFTTSSMRLTTQGSDPSSTTSRAYWASSSGFIPYVNSTSRYWRANRTYKWIAVWKP